MLFLELYVAFYFFYKNHFILAVLRVSESIWVFLMKTYKFLRSNTKQSMKEGGGGEI